MSHEFDIITRTEKQASTVSSVGFGLTSNVPINWQGSGFDLGNMDYDNSFLIFNLKYDSWPTISRFRVQLRWESAAASGYLQKDFTESTFLNRFDVNSEYWTAFKIPLNDFSFQDVTSFDVSSTMYFQVQIFDSTSEDLLTLKFKDVFFEYGNNIIEDHVRHSLVTSGGGDAIELFPEFDLENDQKKIQTNLRLWDGSQFSYKFGGYDTIKFSQRYFPDSSANVANSLWLTNAPSIFVTCNSYNADIYDVKLMGANKPFRKFSTPYIDLMDGKIHMETYE